MQPPLSIITGFLGSGKTTLLQHILTHGLHGRRVGLLVNEIGDVGFDGRIIEGTHAGRMIELTSGCICCSIGSDFLLAVEDLIDSVTPDLIIIETTGLAEPSGLIRQARAGGLVIDAIITLVDVANLQHELEISPVVEWQLRAADFLVLNKCDLVTPPELEAIHTLLHTYNPRAAHFETVHGALDSGVLFGIQPDAPALRSDDFVQTDTSDHLHSDRIGTFLWQSQLPLQRERLVATLASLPAQIYRVKGFVHCTDAPWPTMVNLVCGRVDYADTRFKTPPDAVNELVLIGSDLDGLRDDICIRLDACTDTPDRVADWQARRA